MFASEGRSKRRKGCRHPVGLGVRRCCCDSARAGEVGSRGAEVQAVPAAELARRPGMVMTSRHLPRRGGARQGRVEIARRIGRRSETGSARRSRRRGSPRGDSPEGRPRRRPAPRPSFTWADFPVGCEPPPAKSPACRRTPPRGSKSQAASDRSQTAIGCSLTAVVAAASCHREKAAPAGRGGHGQVPGSGLGTRRLPYR